MGDAFPNVERVVLRRGSSRQGDAEQRDITVRWIVSTGDCMGCQAIDYEIRQVDAAFHDVVTLELLHVGELQDSAVVLAFATRARLGITIMSIPSDVYYGTHGQKDTPTALVGVDGKLVWKVVGDAVGSSSEAMIRIINNVLESGSAVAASGS